MSADQKTLFSPSSRVASATDVCRKTKTIRRSITRRRRRAHKKKYIKKKQSLSLRARSASLSLRGVFMGAALKKPRNEAVMTQGDSATRGCLGFALKLPSLACGPYHCSRRRCGGTSGNKETVCEFMTPEHSASCTTRKLIINILFISSVFRAENEQTHNGF